jgi:hypothetical protein
VVRLRFDLAMPKRVFVVIRGPLPSCEVAGVLPVRGRRGANTVDFPGRVKGRQLRPGVYVLSISRVRRPVAGAPTIVVRVISNRRAVALKGVVRDASCATVSSADLARVLHVEGSGGELLAEPASPPAKTAPLVTAGPPKGDEQHDVLGVAIERLTEIDSAGDAVGPLLALLFLTLLGASIITLVTRFVRGSWNP